MDFAECPRLYINDYFERKVNEVDIICEKAVLETENFDDEDSSDSEQGSLDKIHKETIYDTTIAEEKVNLNSLRIDLINKLRSVKQNVLERFDLLESKFTPELCKSDIEKIQDEIFMDQYCFVLEVYEWFPLFELKCGLILFSQYNDDKTEILK